MHISTMCYVYIYPIEGNSHLIALLQFNLYQIGVSSICYSLVVCMRLKMETCV